MLCLGDILLLLQSALSGGYFTTVAECSVWGYFTSVAECSVKPVSMGTQSVLPSLFWVRTRMGSKKVVDNQNFVVMRQCIMY